MDEQILYVTGDVVAAFVSRNAVAAGDMPAVIKTVSDAFAALVAGPQLEPQVRPAPAVPISRSIQHEHIICLEDGAKMQMLRRYLRTHYGLSPEEYRRRWGLPPDYPMTSPAYSARRSAYAKQTGLGKTVRPGQG